MPVFRASERPSIREARPIGDFDPATTHRTFAVALHEIPAAMLAPDLALRLAASAPLARLAFLAPNPTALTVTSAD
jgi:hypothetical protein